MMAGLDHEELHVRRGERTGIYVIVAIHSTALGPALGGARLWRYENRWDGVADALRLSGAMTLKASAAGLDLGGGKCVICADGRLGPERRRLLMADLGEVVESLDGRYVTAEDVGTSPEDMVAISEHTDHVVGLPPELGGAGDPSPWTARGVEAAIRASLARRLDDPSIAGRRICVVGLGHVGLSLAQRLTAAGAELTVSDVVEAKRELAESLGAGWVDPGAALDHECDVLAPCALGGALTSANAGRLRAAIVCGSANNVLADDGLAEVLGDRGVLYAPDFIANAGGLIAVGAEQSGAGQAHVADAVDGIESLMERVFDLAEATNSTPQAAGREIAAQRLDSALARAAA